MRNVLFFCLLLTALGFLSCSRQVEPNELQMHANRAQAQTLDQILENGVLSTADYSVLRAEHVYPFNVLSEEGWEELETATVFHQGELVGLQSSTFMEEWTEEEAKIFFRVLLRAEPIIESANGYKSNFRAKPKKVTGPVLYLPKNGGAGINGEVHVSAGWIPEIVQEFKDCRIGHGYCDFAIG